MSTYTVHSLGYYDCPNFPTLEEAREHMMELVRESLAKARRTGHKQARKHKLSPDCYRVTLGSDPNSTLYSHHCITA